MKYRIVDNSDTTKHSVSEAAIENIFAFKTDNSLYKLAKVDSDRWAWVTVNKIGSTGDHYFTTDIYDSKRKALEETQKWASQWNKGNPIYEFDDSIEFFKWCIEEIK